MLLTDVSLRLAPSKGYQTLAVVIIHLGQSSARLKEEQTDLPAHNPSTKIVYSHT